MTTSSAVTLCLKTPSGTDAPSLLASMNPVLTQPGETSITLMPLGPSSPLRASVNERT